MLPTIMSRGPIDLWTRTPRSIAPFSASAPSHHSLSSADFITNIAESDFWYTQLEIQVIDPALARTFVGQAVNMLEQKKPDHKPCRKSRPTIVAVQRCDLAVDKVPVDLTRELHQLVPHVDDLVQLRAEQITRSCRLVLLRPHRSLRYADGITLLDSRESENEIASFQRLRP